MNEWSDFAKILKFERRCQHMTQADLAEKMGVDASYISQIECCKREPSLFNFRKLLDALSVSADYLLARPMLKK